MIPNPEVTIGSSLSILEGAGPIITYVTPDGDVWHLSGGLSPVLGAQEGVNASRWKGLQAPGKVIAQQSARQDGDDWLDTVFDALEIDFTVDVYGRTPESFRSINRSWIDSWSMTRSGGQIHWFTRSAGEWWMNVRQGKEISDELTLAPINSFTHSWVARTDGIPFWRSFDSTDQFNPQASSASGFVSLVNRGNLPSPPRYIFQGPGTVVIGDGLSGASVTFGPLAAGQTALITTQANIRSVKELTTNANLYPLLQGRFQTPLDPVGDKPLIAHIPVSVTGAAPGTTQLFAAVTPYRTYPE